LYRSTAAGVEWIPAPDLSQIATFRFACEAALA
jgi:hypothetical protein